MDYNSEKFKSALRELADKNIAMFNAADEATQDVTLLELREIILADSEERTPNIKDSTKKAQQEYASFLLQHVASLLAFAKENFEIDTIENAAVYLQSGWSKIVIVLGLFSKSLDAERIEQGYTDKTLSELLYEAELDDTGYPVPDSELYKLMVAAEQVKATPHVHASPIVKTLYPLDKMNSVTYGRSVEDYEKTLEINVASKKSDKAINVTYSVNFEALGASVSRSLSHFDKQVCIAAAAHYAAGNTVVSLSQIYTAMGNTGRPSQKQIAKIGESVDKLAKTEITIDNTEEASLPRIRGGDPPQSAYHEPQCPFSPHARGGDCDGTKHPPLYPFFPRMRGARCTRPRDASRCRREELYANGDVTSYIHGRGTSRGRSDASAYTADSKRWILQALC